MSLILGFFGSGIGRKLAIYAGIALAVLLVIVGIYRAGGKAAEGAATRKALDRTIRNVKVRQDVRREIAQDAREGRSAEAKLRDKWSRD